MGHFPRARVGIKGRVFRSVLRLLAETQDLIVPVLKENRRPSPWGAPGDRLPALRPQAETHDLGVSVP